MCRHPVGRSLLAIVLLALLISPGCVDAKKVVCDASSKHSCLPECQGPFKCAADKAKCLTVSMRTLFSLLMTPASGPSVPAFLAVVAKLAYLIEPNVVARITPLGVYKTLPVLCDYLATFVHPLGVGSLQSVVGFDSTAHVTSGNVVSSTANLHLLNKASKIVMNQTITGFTRFSNNMKISHMDFTFIRLPEYDFASQGMPLSVFSDPSLDIQRGRVPDSTLDAFYSGIIMVNEDYCVPNNVSGYFGNTTAARQADAMSFLTGIPRVDPFGIVGNNTFCRFVHSAYASVDPITHCPHIGRTGGNFCVPQVYTDYYSVFPKGTFVVE